MSKKRRNALITGGTKGIGLTIAEALLANGFNVILTFAHDEVSARQTQSNLSAKFPSTSVRTLLADSSDLGSVETIGTLVDNLELQLDALVLNAGTTDRSNFEDLNFESWFNVFNVNVHFPTFLIQRLLHTFSSAASITFTGSAMGVYPHSMSLAYGVTKASVHALVKNLVKFLAPHNIRVNAIAPGFVDTEWQKLKPQVVKDNINAKVALNRFADPSEISDAYLFAINNPYLNGEVLVVDGGYSYR